MSSMATINSKLKATQGEIARQTEDFLNKGGEIKVCNQNESANIVFRISDFSINGKMGTGQRKSPTKKGIK